MTDSVAKQSAAVQAMSESWDMIGSLMGGTGAMRKAGAVYLPVWPQEDGESYKARLGVSVLHPVFSRTVQVMAAKPFVQDPKVDPELPDVLNPLKKDADLNGTGFAEFFADRLIECLAYGVSGVLVDYSGDGARTVAEEKQKGSRPYFSVYPAKSLLGWRTDDKGVLTQIRLSEVVTEPEGEFGEKSIEQVRVLTVGMSSIYRKNDKSEWVLFDEKLMSTDRIPFVFFYGIKKSFGVGVSPLLDLAYMNVEHWQSCSDQQAILHVARVPILFAKGFQDTTLVIGAGCATKAEDPAAELSYVEHSGTAIDAGAESIKQLEERMLNAGAELLAKRSGMVTAHQVKTESSANQSTLQNIVEEFEAGVEMCLLHAMAWLGQKQDFSVDLFKDFEIGLTENDMTYILQAVEAGVLSKEDLINEMVRRNMICPQRPEAQTFLTPEKSAVSSVSGDPTP